MRILTILIGITFILFSCNSENKSSSETVSGSEKSSDCLKAFQEDYTGLLTREDMASVHPIDFDQAEQELRGGRMGEYIYTWESSRAPMELTIANQKITVPDYNSMGILQLSFYSEDNKSPKGLFDRGYKTLSEEELKEIEDNINKQSEDVKKSAEGFMKIRKESNWDYVDDVGTSAWYKWSENYGGELVVLSGRAQFKIRLKTSTDPQENLEKAKLLAQKVIDKCH